MLRRASIDFAGHLWRRRVPAAHARTAVGSAPLRHLSSTSPSAEGSVPEEAAAADAAEATTEAEPLSEHEALLVEKNTAIAGLNDRVLRALAEMENVRAIARRDVAHAREFGITSFARGLLDVADNLGLALKAVPQERLEADEVLRGLHFGVEATERELQKVLKQNGVQKFGETGEVFDPNRHQALFEAPSADVAPGTVIQVAKTGYAIGDRLLRPAEVGVSKTAS
jgi:molecular chaperone GrpE